VEFAVTLSFSLDQVPPSRREGLLTAERDTATDYYSRGIIGRMWRITGRAATLSIWNAADDQDLQELLAKLPLLPWMTVEVLPLASHYLEDDPLKRHPIPRGR
jgi:muconolactone D-isomerase